MRRKISLILALCGIALIALGLATGGKTSMYWNGSGFHLENSIPYEKYSFDKFNQVKINARVSAVELVRGEEYSVELYHSSIAPQITISDNILTIEQPSQRIFLNFGFSFRTNVIKITVPHGISLESCNISSDNGRVSVKDQNLGSLNITDGNGRVTLSNVTATTLDINCKNGSLTLNNVITDHLNASLNNGRLEGNHIEALDAKIFEDNGSIDLEAVSFRGSEISSDNGSIKIQGDLRSSFIKSQNGSVKLNLAKQSDTHFHLRSYHGSVKFNNSSSGAFWESGSPGNPNTIKVESRNGSIRVNTN